MHYEKGCTLTAKISSWRISLVSGPVVTTVLVAGGGVTPADGEVPTAAMVTIPAEVVDGSVPAVSASLVNSAPITFWRLGSGGEAKGLQNRQCKHSTIPIFDNSTEQPLYTWKLRALYVCALPDDPEGPMARIRPTPWMIRGSCSSLPSLRLPFPPGGSRFWSSRRRAEHQKLELFSLQPWCWEEGGLVGGCRVVVDNSGKTLCVPAEDFSASGYKNIELIPKKSNTYRLRRILCRKQLRDVGNCVHVQQHSLDPDECGIVSQLLYAHPRWVFSTYVLEA
jgi:hypothetical protein